MRRVSNSHGLGTVTAGQAATDSQATAAGFPAVGQLASTEDFQVVVPSGTGFALQDAGTIPQAVLQSLGISVSASQNLNQAQTQSLLNAVALAAVAATAGTTVAAVSPCSIALFSDTTCLTIGSTTIGTTTAIALGAAAIALFVFFGSKH